MYSVLVHGHLRKAVSGNGPPLTPIFAFLVFGPRAGKYLLYYYSSECTGWRGDGWHGICKKAPVAACATLMDAAAKRDNLNNNGITSTNTFVLLA